jgi:hypothetical protein
MLLRLPDLGDPVAALGGLSDVAINASGMPWDSEMKMIWSVTLLSTVLVLILSRPPSLTRWCR